MSERLNVKDLITVGIFSVIAKLNGLLSISQVGLNIAEADLAFGLGYR